MIGKTQIARAKVAIQLWQHLGLGWMAYRVKYALQQRAGTMRKRLPATLWNEQPLTNFLNEHELATPQAYMDYRKGQSLPFFFLPEQREQFSSIFNQWDIDGSPVIEIADQIVFGKLHYFERTVGDMGSPPNWFRNPFTQDEAPADQHWSEIPDFGYGDIKVIWEPSRFSFAYTLVRAYWRTGDEAYAQLFWSLVEDWRQHNPPQTGPNWKCGQETTFRVMAWTFGLYGFADSASSTPERVATLAQMIAISGHRIESNLDYALSQRNNHGISEGVGLWTIGLNFPEFKSANSWLEKGREVLEALAQELIYDDGAFSQNSVNYHRVMLHDYLWAIRLGDIHGQPLSQSLKERVDRAANFLYQLQDEESGSLPLYGPNDGALILPLSNCDYLDFRPAIGAARYLTSQQRSYDAGPWDEELFWLFGAEVLDNPVGKTERKNFSAEPSGYYTLRSENGFVFTRCGLYKDRPGNADALHVDLWWKGENIACDASTYSYNAPQPWNYALSRTQYHNTVAVDGRDQMDKVGKFLWLPWLTTAQRYATQSEAGHLTYWEGEHHGYHRLEAPTTHVRSIVQLPSEQWLILDRLESQKNHDYCLHWLLNDYPFEWDEPSKRVTLSTPKGGYQIQLGASIDTTIVDLQRALPDDPRGWRSPYYMTRQPALSIALSATAQSINFWTLLGPGTCQVTATESGLTLSHALWQAELTIDKESGSSGSKLRESESLVSNIDLLLQDGSKDELAINQF